MKNEYQHPYRKSNVISFISYQSLKELEIKFGMSPSSCKQNNAQYMTLKGLSNIAEEFINHYYETGISIGYISVLRFYYITIRETIDKATAIGKISNDEKKQFKHALETASNKAENIISLLPHLAKPHPNGFGLKRYEHQKLNKNEWLYQTCASLLVFLQSQLELKDWNIKQGEKILPELNNIQRMMLDKAIDSELLNLEQAFQQPNSDVATRLMLVVITSIFPLLVNAMAELNRMEFYNLHNQII